MDDASIAHLSEQLYEHEPELVETALRQVRREIPVFAGAESSPLGDALVDGITEQIRQMVIGLRRGREVPSGASSVELGLAREVARSGVPVDTLLKAYRIVHRVMWNAAAAYARATAETDKVVASMLVASRYLFSFTHVVTRALIVAYGREQADRARARQRRENQVVRDVLSGLPFDRFQVAYGFDLQHVGVVAEGEEAEATIRRIADAGGADVLATRHDTQVWAWMGFPRERLPAARELARAFASSRSVTGDGCVGVGEIAAGVDGFRQTHRQALRAFDAARRFSWPYAAYDDVSLVALVSVDPEAAETFVRRELGPLLAPGRRTAGLRATLSAYFSTGQKSSTAKFLGVSDRTVSYRLAAVEAALGRPVDARRLELSIALRLAQAQGIVDGGDGAP